MDSEYDERIIEFFTFEGFFEYRKVGGYTPSYWCEDREYLLLAHRKIPQARIEGMIVPVYGERGEDGRIRVFKAPNGPETMMPGVQGYPDASFEEVRVTAMAARPESTA